MAANNGDYIPLELTEGCPCDGCAWLSKCADEQSACKLFKMWTNNPRPSKVIEAVINDMRKKTRTPTRKIFIDLNKEGPLGSRRRRK